MTNARVSSPGHSSPGQPPPGSHGEAGARVLVIDDSATILKVVTTILELHQYDVVVAHDGRDGLEALKTRGPFDLCLLDFVMPKMNGYQFCRELRADKLHKKLPVVLMSARTSAIGDRFVEQTGAVDALGKPFDARALVAVVGSVLAKRRGAVEARSMPSPDEMADEESLIIMPGESWRPPTRQLDALEELSIHIADAIGPHIRQLGSTEIHRDQALRDAVALGINLETMMGIAPIVERLDLGDKTEIMRGDMAKLPLAEALQLFQMRRQGGVVTVEDKKKKKKLVIWLRAGTVDLARAEGFDDEFLLGRYFVSKGWVTREEIDRLADDVPRGELIGEWLVKEGHLTEEQLKDALVRQSEELVYEVLRWPGGTFVVKDVPFAQEAEKAELGLGLSGLVLEGFRRVDEWRLMADTVDFNAILAVDQVALGTVDDGKFSEHERLILMAIDGKRSVREMIEATDIASFDAIKAIYRFLQSRIAREMVATTNTGSSMSLSSSVVRAALGNVPPENKDPNDDVQATSNVQASSNKSVRVNVGAVKIPSARPTQPGGSPPEDIPKVLKR